jgi:ferredoxin like protein
MNDQSVLKAKLGLDVFKPGKEPHIRIKAGFEKDPLLKPAVKICPAGCYSENENGEVSINVDGCLECGTCRVTCGTAVLDWNYPEGGFGVQFRCG